MRLYEKVLILFISEAFVIATEPILSKSWQRLIDKNIGVVLGVNEETARLRNKRPFRHFLSIKILSHISYK